jgi:hypothetical protein
MWSSFHSARALVFALGGLFAAGVAPAAETYVQPIFDMGATHHTNRGLNFGEAQDRDDATGMEFDGALVLGIVTPASRTLLRPNVKYEAYFSNENLDNADYGLDLSHRYVSPRHEFEVIGRAQRRETLSTQYIEPGFDDFDPNDPTVTDPGLLEVDDTITRVQLRPSYGYRVTQRATVGIDVVAQTIRFGEEGSLARVDYDYGRGGLSWEFQATERTTVFFDPYVARYETKDESYASDSEGVAFGFEHDLSETFTFGLTAAVENDHVERIPFIDTPGGPVALPLVEEDNTNWSAMANVYRKGELSELRFSAGRLISPSTRGSKVTVNQVNLEWQRLLSPRLEFFTAGRYMREERIGTIASDGRRETAGVEAGMRWRMTERWHVQVRAEALRREFEFLPEAANDESLFIGIGYAGLGSQAESTD